MRKYRCVSIRVATNVLQISEGKDLENENFNLKTNII